MYREHGIAFCFSKDVYRDERIDFVPARRLVLAF